MSRTGLGFSSWATNRDPTAHILVFSHVHITPYMAYGAASEETFCSLGPLHPRVESRSLLEDDNTLSTHQVLVGMNTWAVYPSIWLPLII